MKKILILIPLTLALSACNHAKKDTTTSPQMMNHSDDTKGSSYFPSQRASTGNKVVVFAPKATAWAAYDANGNRIKTGRASGGKHFCPDVGRGCKTTVGSYKFYSKKGADCKSGKYPIETGGGAPMPYCMHFNGGYAMHGSYNVPCARSSGRAGTAHMSHESI